jgi:hypothetical protein
VNNGSSIAPHIFALAVFLSVTWGIYLVYTVLDYRRVLREVTTQRPVPPDFSSAPRRRGEILAALRRMIVAWCQWLFVFSFVFRTAMVLLGLDNQTVGLVIFFALAGSNVLGSLYVVISLRYD